MKQRLQKIYTSLLKLIPIVSCLMLSAVVNSSGSWVRGQEELPADAKKYRKF